MDALTRVRNAMKKLPVDRVPAGFLKHFEDQTDNTVTGQAEWALKTGMDILTIELDGYMEFASETPLRTTKDWGSIRPHKKTDHYFVGQYDRTSRIAEKLGTNCASIYSFFSPYSVIKHTVGGEHLVNELYKEDPKAMTEAMKVIEEDNLALIDMIKDSGVTGAAISFQNAEEWRFTSEEYREILTPWDKRLLGAVREGFEYVISHLCSWGNEPNHMDVWKDYDHMCVNWGVHIERDLPTLSAARTYFDSNPSIMGGFDVRPGKLIVTGTEGEIKNYTKALIRGFGTEGFLIGCDCSLQDDTPDQNIQYVIEATKEFAQGI